MNALRLAAFLAVAATASMVYVSEASAQSAATLGRPAGPTRQVDTRAIPQPGAQGKVFPLGSSWIAVSLNGKPFTGAERPSFKLDDQMRATGFAGCNNYSTTAYPLREQGLAVAPFALTKRSCDKAAQAVEQAFLMALRTSGKWDIQGRTLIIKSQTGELRLERAL